MNKRYYEHTLSTTREFIEYLLSIYDLSDDSFAMSPEYDALYTELTGAVVLYIEEHGV